MGELRQPEVENLGPAITGDEQVLRFQIAVNNSLVVRSRQSFGNLLGVVERLARGERARTQALAQ
jgi:hypothetical protein